MARTFNGTTQYGTATLDLSSYSVISLSFWLWWNVFANDDDLAMEHSTNYGGTTGFLVNPNSSPGSFGFGFSKNPTPPVGFWADGFTRPSAAAWHHYLLVMNRATPSNAAWVDGVSQTLIDPVHQSITYGNFANQTLYVMSRAGSSLFGAGRLAELSVWGGVALGQNHATALASGKRASDIEPLSCIHYSPMYGYDSPEPTWHKSGGTRSSVTLVNSPTQSNGPPVAMRKPWAGTVLAAGNRRRRSIICGRAVA